MTAITAAALALPGTGVGVVTARDLKPFRVPLAIPPVMSPVRRERNRDIYEVTMRKATAEILPGKRTRTWTFDGSFPGPTIEATRGREIVIRRRNALRVPTTTHLHGGEVPWRSDGHPGLAIAPGQTYEYVYPNQQEAATLWYHDHLCKHTSKNNYMGLAGLYIIRDEAEEELNLPRGRYDIPLVLQDRRFHSDGSFAFKDKVDDVLGDVYLVNGRPMPFLKVANRKYRFRILNASHSRGYRLTLDSGEPLIQIGSDQGLLAAPTPGADIPLWPAERAEVVIDFSKYPVGSRIVLQDAGDAIDPTAARPLMRFEVNREEDDTSSLPPVLRQIEKLLPLPGVVEREFVLRKNATGKWVINGKPFDAQRIDISPKLGDTEVWTFNNQSSVTHPMHIHLVRFQVLDRSNLQVSPTEMGWKDTVRVDPSARVRVIMRFDGFTGRYMYHCHNLAHEDHSMMGQMRVTGRSEMETTAVGGYVGSTATPALPYRCDIRR